MSKEIQNQIKKTTVKRNIQLYSFVATGIAAIAVITLTIMGIFTLTALLALIPMILMMKKNVEMWDLYDSVIILQKCLSDKEYLEQFLKDNQ